MLFYYIFRQSYFLQYCRGDVMHVKIFDENHELDLESSINEFLQNDIYDIMDIKYQVAITMSGEDQIYCFSAMVIYYEK